jgi:hypothetical protein
MNFIAIIGIVDSLRQIKNDNSSTLKVRVEKPMLETNDED